ncbi:glutathione S-transferase-like protein [Panus rudis PR-1116 ss-1]|nr:glutathione S-transferase-like protein [Panus rudis PR-1116 ss-1]
MTIHIYGSPSSTCTRRVAVVLEELKVPYVLHPIDFTKGEHKAPSFLEHQPFGQVPYIVDDANDNFEVYESRAIARYLVLKYGKESGLIPGLATGDVKALAKFEQAASVETANFDPSASGLAFEKIFKQMYGGQPDEKLAETYTATLQAKLDGYESILSKSKYLAGDSISIADLFHLPYGMHIEYLIPGILENDSKRPSVARWWKDISNRPSWLAVKDGVTKTA